MTSSETVVEALGCALARRSSEIRPKSTLWASKPLKPASYVSPPLADGRSWLECTAPGPDAAPAPHHYVLSCDHVDCIKTQAAQESLKAALLSTCEPAVLPSCLEAAAYTDSALLHTQAEASVRMGGPSGVIPSIV